MKLTFLGTRGNIEARTARHHMHTSLMVSYYGRRVMVDCGDDWRGQCGDQNPDALILTHAHPDHAFGLKDGAPCPVYAREVTWEAIEDFPILERHRVEDRTPQTLAGITFEAFPVDHSTKAPAAGYRIQAGKVAVFYVPDVVWIHDREAALHDVDLYIGDGATITRSMVRNIEGNLIGHTPIRTQLTWCEKEGVPRAIITHCGSQIVEGDERTLGAELRKMGQERGVDVSIAHDGQELVLR